MKGARERVKRYVSVTTRVDEDGRVRPLSIQWYDGRTYPIDELRAVKFPSNQHNGASGARYTIRIGEKITQLFFEDPRWYVEEILWDEFL